ncbi:hypothetical protein [Flavobacterium aquiphilum]|uniref:hypothetical protein n=1 Tax=Flavobacterium aquiphilum TaxID=3003261 RepID=UPI0024803966|nr:hypothetical protein [Flavobacterium aquiphilum]
MKLIIKTFCLLFFFQSFSQTVSNQEKIKNYIDTYFNYEREIIHVQFNKNIYANSEDLAFKGYVWSRNTNSPNNNTANIQLIVYNEKEEIVLQQLLFTNKGTFAGGVHLNDKFKTGKYYFHFYTNWMNNFKEDDSFVQTIEIIDKNDSYNFKTNEPNWKSATVTIHPESGSIINDINNTIGVSIKDCNKKGIETDGIIVDSKSNEISHFRTNKMGNGAFYLIPKTNETYTLKIKSDKLNILQILPKVQETGIIITYNNNLPNNKLIIDAKTNEKGLDFYQNKKFSLLIQQDGKSAQKEFSFDNKETDQTLILDKQNLSEGVNIIRLIDEDLNEITERLIYIYPTSNPITTLETKNTVNDSIALYGKTGVNQANLSISVLPENNICTNQKRSIIGTFHLNAYLENPEIDNYTYFDQENKAKKQEMELLMLNQNKSKFLWENIKTNPPKTTNHFDKGVTIRGTVDKIMNADSKYTMSLFSLKNSVFEKTTIDKDSHFKFENFFAQDSTVFILQMINEKNATVAAKIQAKVFPNQNMFPLPMQFDKTICTTEKSPDNGFKFKNPPGNKAINLNEVVVKNNAKKALKHQKDMSSFATAYKIDEGSFERVLDFIGRNGYRTGMDPQTGEVFIRSNRNSYLGDSSAPPTVYIDNMEVFDLNFLFNLSLSEVDEIYIDQSGSSDVTSRGHGTIKIFLKDVNSMNKYITVKYTTMIVTNGFTPNIKYHNSLFETPEEFNYFGTLDWSPNIATKDNSSFEIKLPKGNQKEFQVYLEGFSDDGQLVSEIRKVSLSNNTSDTANNIKPGQ